MTSPSSPVVSPSPARTPNTGAQQLVFDVGMFDGADTAHYLSTGRRVVSVEANPELARQGAERFQKEVASGQLTIVNCAIAAEHGEVTLHLCGQDLGSSSISEDRVINRRPAGAVTVKTVPITSLFEQYGVPHFLKVDIEGHDRYCILPLTADSAPAFVSFEIGNDFDELVTHLHSIGYRGFKIISQLKFRELARAELLTDRLAARVRRTLGLGEAAYVRRKGYRFKTGHSSGPMPENSDGSWFDFQKTLDRWSEHLRTKPRGGWWDLHAYR